MRRTDAIILAVIVVIVVIVIVVVVLPAQRKKKTRARMSSGAGGSVLWGSSIYLGTGGSKYLAVSAAGTLSLSTTPTAFTLGGDGGGVTEGDFFSLHDAASGQYLVATSGSSGCSPSMAATSDTSMWSFETTKFGISANPAIVSGGTYVLVPNRELGWCADAGALNTSLGFTHNFVFASMMPDTATYTWTVTLA